MNDIEIIKNCLIAARSNTLPGGVADTKINEALSALSRIEPPAWHILALKHPAQREWRITREERDRLISQLPPQASPATGSNATVQAQAPVDVDWPELERRLAFGCQEPDWDCAWVVEIVKKFCHQRGLLRGVPEGFVLVPVEPTEEMIAAGNRIDESQQGTNIDEIYTAMIAAAAKEEG